MFPPEEEAMCSMAGTPRWYPCDYETREQSERSVKGSGNSANDVIPSIALQMCNSGVCVSKGIESVDKVPP